MRKVLRKLSIEHLWGLTILAGIFAFLNTQPIQQNDFWWHLAAGREIIQSGHLPQVDLYSISEQGKPYPSYKIYWLAESGLYLLFLKGGPAVTILVNSLIVTAAYSLLFFTAWRRSNHWRASAFAVFFAAALGFGNWAVRPQTITYLYGVLILVPINEYRITRKRGWILLLPVMMLLWVNCHGSFPIGLILIGLWFADELWQAVIIPTIGKEKIDKGRLREPIFACILSGMACFINPSGMGILRYLTTMAGNSVVQSAILEWQPPTLNTLEGAMVLIGILAVIVVLSISPKRPGLFDLSLFLVFAFLGFKYIRGSIWFGIVMAPVLAVHLSALVEKWSPQDKPQGSRPATNPAVNIAFVGLLLFLCGLSLPWFKHILPLVPQKAALYAADTPFAAAQFLQRNDLPGFVFNDMSFGSYLIYTAYPSYSVFVDSRIELYPEIIWNDYWKISTAQCGWEALLDSYQMQTLLLNPNMESQLIQAVHGSPQWQEVYQDEVAVIFTRKTP